MEYVFEGIRLREAIEEDLEFIFESEHAVTNCQYVIPCSMEWHKKGMENSDRLHLIAEKTDGGQKIGFVILAGLEDPDDCLEFMRIVVNEKGKGYGRKILRIIKKIAFEKYKAHRLWLDVKDYNERAIHLYKSEGFIIEGKHRECVKTGDIYETLYIMAMLAQEYKQLLAVDSLKIHRKICN